MSGTEADAISQLLKLLVRSINGLPVCKSHTKITPNATGLPSSAFRAMVHAMIHGLDLRARCLGATDDFASFVALEGRV